MSLIWIYYINLKYVMFDMYYQLSYVISLTDVLLIAN